MIVPVLLVAMVAILLAHAVLLRQRARLDEPVRRAGSAPLAPLSRAHAVDARHWNSAYCD